MFRYFTLDDFDFKGKTIGLRIDINSPIINGRITLNERIIAHCKTIEELSEKGAKIVILAHQGRKGNSDCISLKSHSKLISKQTNLKIDFINEVFSEKVANKINSMKNSDVLMLENLRFYDDEINVSKTGNIIKKLEKYFDYYVFDAFSVAHRNQTSVVGFSKIINIAGRVMEKEIRGLNLIEKTPRDHIFVFGGAKPDDLVKLMEIALSKKRVDLILLTGVIGEIALHLNGYYLGKKYEFLKKHGYLNSIDKIKFLIQKYKNDIIIPKDVALEKDGKRIEIPVETLNENKKLLDKYLIQDIGMKTVKYYDLHLIHAGSIYLKGPAGNFEEKNFQKGTIELLKVITKSNAFKFMGGGHSVTAAKDFGFINKFNYVSLAGGALVKFLSGEELPGIKVLEKSFENNEKTFEDFIVVGSNTVDFSISVDSNWRDINLGDKIKLKDDFKKTVGGGGVNVSICLSRLGAKVGYIGKLSYEELDLIKKTLSRNNIKAIENKLSKRPIAKSVLIDTADNDRVIFTYKGQNDFLETKDINYSKFNTNYFYFNSMGGESFITLLNMAKKIKKENKKSIICYNPSLYLIKNKSKQIREILKYIDILILNYEEMQEIVNGDYSISDCFKLAIKLGPKILIITDGANGAYCYDGKKEYFQKAIPTKVVDTTGAGDSFAGTFFYFYSKGYGIRKSMEFAVKNSANVIKYKGAQLGLMYYQDLVKKN